jgi:ankyrin repeat protein
LLRGLARQDGATPLCIASHNSHVEVVGALLVKGADVEAKTDVRAS